MITRLKQAISKVIFCFHRTKDTYSFFKLLLNTHQFKRRLKTDLSHTLTNEVAERYHINLNKKNLQIFLRTYSGDIAIFYEVFWNKVYELPGECFEHAKTIVDLGANIGMASLCFMLSSPGALIYAVEPESSNFELMLKNLQTGIAGKSIIPLRAAIDSEDGVASIQLNDMRYNSSIIKTTKNHDVVRTLSMNSLLKEFSLQRIDILKIDIEGSERKLFEADTAWLDQVHYLLIEFHSEAIKAFCLDVLLSRNYTIHPIKKGNQRNNLFWAEQTLQF